MKIEARELTSDESPFRGQTYGVIRDGRVAAYCFDSITAEAIRLILTLTSDKTTSGKPN